MFTNVSAKIVGDKVVVTVVEGRQIVNRVAFEGNSKLKGDQLDVEVQSKAHAAFNEDDADADIDRIKDAYKKIGRNAVKVSYRLVPLPNGRVDLVFKVDEGDKTGVKSITFVGNNNVSNWRLNSLMQTTEMNLLSWFKTSDVYNPDTLATDEEAIRKYYMQIRLCRFPHHQHGRRLSTPIRSGYIVTISLDEGPQYHVSGVTVTSQFPKRRTRDDAETLRHAASPAMSTTRPRSTNPSRRSRANSRGTATRLPTSARMASATTPTTRSRWRSRSTTRRRSISSASTSSATRARATTSSGASSTSAKATPTTTR